LSHAGLIHLVAHRGNARDYPENTLPAFASAMSAGLRFLELDVQLSADGIPMVIHDHELRRTTGVPGCVFDLSARQLTRIDAHEPRRFGDRFRGTHIPLLADVLALLDGRPDVTLFVEIKSESLAHFGHEQVIERLLQDLHAARSQCVVISFDLAAVFRVRQVGGLAIGWVLEQYDSHSRLKYEAVQPEFLFCDLKKLPEHQALWRGPWRWAIYEVQSFEVALSLAERGAHYIETMAVSAMSAALRSAQSASASSTPGPIGG
jgi:glycerophosphoryl diester phosphodiesterase